MMTPAELTILHATLASVAGQPDAAATHFFGRLTAIAPGLRDLVPAKSKGAAFVYLLTTAITGLERPATLAEPMQKLGRLCDPHRMDAKLYAAIGEALLQSLALALGSALTEEAHTAWADGYVQLAETMMAAYYNRFDLVA